MTPEERQALIDQYMPSREEVGDEVRDRTEAAERRMQEKRERGEVLTSWSKDNTPIGLNDNFEPFPLTEREHEQQPDDETSSTGEDMNAETQPTSTPEQAPAELGPVVSTVSVPADAVLAYGIGRQTLGSRDPESGEWITTDENQGHA